MGAGNVHSDFKTREGTLSLDPRTQARMSDQVDVFARPREDEAAWTEKVPIIWNRQLGRKLRKGGFVVEGLVARVNGRLDTGGFSLYSLRVASSVRSTDVELNARSCGGDQ